MSANSWVLAGPMGPEEGILYADIDLEVAVRSKLVQTLLDQASRRYDLLAHRVPGSSMPRG